MKLEIISLLICSIMARRRRRDGTPAEVTLAEGEIKVEKDQEYWVGCEKKTHEEDSAVVKGTLEKPADCPERKRFMKTRWLGENGSEHDSLLETKPARYTRRQRAIKSKRSRRH